MVLLRRMPPKIQKKELSILKQQEGRRGWLFTLINGHCLDLNNSKICDDFPEEYINFFAA